MQSSLRDRIAEVLYRQHYRLGHGNSDDITWDDLEPALKDVYRDDADAVIAELDEARTATTPDQLASLPFLAVVRETYTSAAGWEHSLIWERRSGNENWACIAAPIPPKNTVPNLPAVVLWPTDWSNHD